MKNDHLYNLIFIIILLILLYIYDFIVLYCVISMAFLITNVLMLFIEDLKKWKNKTK